MLTRRSFLWTSAALGTAAQSLQSATANGGQAEAMEPIGEARGIHPGRVVWVHDPEAIDWKGPGDGHWYESQHTRQDHVDAMMALAVCDLTGEATIAGAWNRLFRHLNQAAARAMSATRRARRSSSSPTGWG